MDTLENIITECEGLSFDLNFTYAKNWKKENKNRLLVGYLPIYFPREIIHAAGICQSA